MTNTQKKAAAVLTLIGVVAALVFALGSKESYKRITELPDFKSYVGPGSLDDESQLSPGGVTFFLSENVTLPEREALLYEVFYEHDPDRLGLVRDVLGAENMTLDDGAVQGGGSVFHVEQNGEWWFSNPSAGVLCQEREPEKTLTDSTGQKVIVPGGCKKSAEKATKEQALAVANKIIEAVGSDPANSEYYSDTETQSITNNTNSMTTYVSFGEGGAIQYASGRLGVLREHGSWPLADPTKIVSDLGVKADPAATIPGCSKDCGKIPETKVEIVRIEVTSNIRQDKSGVTWIVPMYALYDAGNVVWYTEALEGAVKAR